MNFYRLCLLALFILITVNVQDVFAQIPDSIITQTDSVANKPIDTVIKKESGVLNQKPITVTGKVVDSKTGAPMDFASVALFNDKSVSKTTATTLTGDFSFKDIPNGNYSIRIGFVGYTPFVKKSFSVNSPSGVFSLGTIMLVSSNAKVLKEVVVTGQKSTIQLGIDRKIFNVDQSMVSQGGSVTDLLSNIPSVSVDIDGNINLRGTNNVRILIDGKPSALAGSNIAQLLQSIPASSIQNIELVTNPSSKYDAEGQSGIINIVLKKNQKIGLNGSVALTAGTQENYNANTSLSYRNDKWNLFGNYSFRNGNRIGTGFNNTDYFNNTTIDNQNDNRRTDVSNTVKLGAEYSPSQKTTIGLSGNLSVRDNKRIENLNYQYFNIPDRTGTSTRNSIQQEDDHGCDLNLDINQKFKRKGEELTGNVSYGKGKEDGVQSQNQDYYAPTGNVQGIPSRRTNDTYEDSKSINIQMDYTLPVNDKIKLEAGYRTSIRRSDESRLSDTLNLLSNNFTRDFGLTNDFSLEDMVHAAYFNYQNQLTKTFGFQMGMRAEQAYLNTQLTSFYAVQPPKGTLSKLDYFRIYPSVFLTKKLAGENQLQLSYSRRVNRPRGWQVNPFLDISDNNNYRQGNPNLKPEDIHSFELSYMKYWKAVTLTSSVYARQVNDVVQPIVTSYDEDKGITLTQFYNLSKNQAAGFEFISKVDVSKAVNLTGNLNLFYNKFTSKVANISSSDGFNWNGNLTTDFKFPSNITAQLRMDYSAPRVMAQGRSKEMYGLDAAVKKDVLNRKATIALNVRNILNSRVWGGTTNTEFFIQNFERQFQPRIANLTFSYRFGKQDFKSNKRERNQQPQNDQPEEGAF
ncbi:MAG: TonB-dependent receptor plug [Sphingobacteriales bacterium]|nr:TonB-dependent receptor plug [Sphingobacteriales bacterium]